MERLDHSPAQQAPILQLRQRRIKPTAWATVAPGINSNGELPPQASASISGQCHARRPDLPKVV